MNSSSVAELAPKEIWGHFYSLTQLPRPSKKEEKVQAHLLNLAQQQGLQTKVDSVGNIVVYVPASPGYENKSPVIIQNHMDMVTDATPDYRIDFSTDPIKTYVEDGYVRAFKTTLGADNGIGCAAAMALMTEKSVAHPPLEILFTVDEESGLHGAWGVEPSFFTGKRMLNLDTEEWGSFYIGCAGGIEYELKKQFQTATPAGNHKCYKLSLKGYCGGHSGIDIHRQRANALKRLGMLLEELRPLDFELSELRGGKAHNIIPRDAFAQFYLDPAKETQARAIIENVAKGWEAFTNTEDGKMVWSLEEIPAGKSVLSRADRDQFLSFIGLFPHGAHRYLHEADDVLVSMSNNLALILLVNGEFYTLTSLRYFDREEVRELEKTVEQLARLNQIELIKISEYPSWKPELKNNHLLELAGEIFEGMHQQKPLVKAIHAGLECGILIQKMGDVQAISFGPTILGAHSPDERVEIKTVQTFWDYLVTLLAKL